MISFKLSELAIFGNYKLLGQDVVINKVSTDSRDCKDALFVALKGERFDGHDYIDSAIENGAKAVLVEKDVYRDDITIIKVSSTRRLLSKISINFCLALSKLTLFSFFRMSQLFTTLYPSTNTNLTLDLVH